jgi:hypothetical protein
LPDPEAKLRDRATRLKRALLKEKRKFGRIDDGAGNRYLIGPLYVLAGAHEAALEFYKWYKSEFSDDSGEPMHYFYWALLLHRKGEIERANAKLLETMIRNVYLLPILLGSSPATYSLWHGSNWSQPTYAAEVPPELLPQLSTEEHSWIEEQLNSFPFRLALDEYVSTFRALNTERDVGKRRTILKRWDEVVRREVGK